MKEKTNIKERIIQVTTQLIEQYKGNTNEITARIIAEKAEVGLGLINYHFGSKQNLITTCVQRIINNIVTAGVETGKEYDTDKESLTVKATYVFNFLFENAAVSRISILSDLQNYDSNTNSVYTQKGFLKSLTKDVKEQDRMLLSFMLTTAMQVAFLGGSAVKEILGYDLEMQEERGRFIEKVVSVLLEGARKESV